MSGSKPVLRTSSLKHVKEPTSQHDAARRRISCGPIIAPGSAKSLEDYTEEELGLTQEDGDFCKEQVPELGNKQIASTGEMEIVGLEHNDSGTAEQDALSLQNFGDDITIQAGLVKKHRMEIETKQDSQQRSTTPQASGEVDSQPKAQESFHGQVQESKPPGDLQSKVTTGDDQTAHRGSLDTDTLALIREIGSALIMRPNTEQSIEEDGEDDEQGEGEEGGKASNMVKYFVNKIEKQTDHSKSPGKIVIVEGHADSEKAAFPATLSDDLQCDTDNHRSGPTKLDLGFAAGESCTDDIPHSTSPSKSQSYCLGDGGEPTVVRHLVDRFEVKSPDQDAGKAEGGDHDGMVKPKGHAKHGDSALQFHQCEDVDHSSNTVKPQSQLHQPQVLKPDHMSPRNIGGVGGGEMGDRISHSPVHSKPFPSPPPTYVSAPEHSGSSLPPSLSSSSSSTSSSSALLSSPPTSFRLKPASSEASRAAGIAHSFDQPPTAASKTPWGKSSHHFTVHAGVSEADSHALMPPSQQPPRPKSADHARDPRFLQQDSTEYSRSLEEGKSDAFTRQFSEEGRKIRKLHGKSHPLTKLASAQKSQARGDHFHSSM